MIRITRSELELLEFLLMDAVHDFGQEPMEKVYSAFCRWANRVCPGFAEDHGCFFEGSAVSPR